MRVSASGVFFTIFVFLAAFNGTLYLVTPMLFLLPISLSIYRRWLDNFLSLWYHLTPAVLEILYGVRIRICGDLGEVRGPCLILLNHRTRLDWLFFWSYIVRMGSPTKHKLVLKHDLKKIPGMGWGMQVCQFIFMTRKWEKDKNILSENLAYFSSRGYPVQLLFFPEGTNLSENTRHKSHKYAELNNLQKYEYVLQPRTTGFVHCMRELRKGVTPPNIVDVTMGYVGNITVNESDLLAGRWPKEIHFCARTIPPSDIPSGEEELAKWLQQQWSKKEEMLEEFYQQRKFSQPYLEEQGFTRTKIALVSVLVFWVAFLALSFYLMLSYPWTTLVVVVLYTGVCSLGPGMNWVLLQLHQMTYQAKLFSKN